MNKKICLLISIVIIIIFIVAYFLINKSLYKDDNSIEVKYKEEITKKEVEEKMNNNGLSKYDFSETVQTTTKSENYLYIDTSKNYEVIYSIFNDLTLSTNNYNTNLNLIKSKYSDLVEITNIQTEKYSKYEGENASNYVVILKIGMSYFQIETTKDNKSNVQGIISNLEN